MLLEERARVVDCHGARLVGAGDPAQWRLRERTPSCDGAPSSFDQRAEEESKEGITPRVEYGLSLIEPPMIFGIPLPSLERLVAR
jgi:hypothetical protein